jgi:hypothetical protein
VVCLDIAARRDGPRASLPSVIPPRKTRSHSHSWGVVGVSPRKGSDETSTGSSAGEDFPLRVVRYERSAYAAVG